MTKFASTFSLPVKHATQLRLKSLSSSSDRLQKMRPKIIHVEKRRLELKRKISLSFLVIPVKLHGRPRAFQCYTFGMQLSGAFAESSSLQVYESSFSKRTLR